MTDEPTIRRKRRNLEDHLQISIVHTLRMTFAEEELIIAHAANGGARDIREAAKLKAMGVLAGFSDLLFFWPERVEHGGVMTKTGRMDCGLVELKVEGNKALEITAGTLNPNQEAFRDRVLAMGGRWTLARSYDDVYRQLIAWAVKPKSRETAY